MTYEMTNLCKTEAGEALCSRLRGVLYELSGYVPLGL